MSRLAAALLWVACVAACAGAEPDGTGRPEAEPTIESAVERAAGSTAGSTVCEEPRPEVCTHEYRPVCGDRDTGVRCVTTPCPSTERVTYGNACTACSDPQVMRYRPGACEVSDR